MITAGRIRTITIAFLAAVVAFVGALLLPFAISSKVSAAPTTLYSQLNDGAWKTAQGTNWLAQSFTSSATPTAITDVSIMFRNASENNGSSNGSTSYSLSIWSSVSGAPGTQLAAVATSVTPGGWSQGTPSYTLGSPLTLAASTQYFVVLTGSAGGTMGWKCNAATPTTSVTPTPTFTALSSSNSGSSWSSLSGACAGQYFGMSVTGSTLSTPTLGAFSNVSAAVGDTAQTITAPTADTAGSFAYSSSNTAVATVSGSTLTFAGVGTSTITADFTPTDTTNYTTASTTMTVTVSQGTPVLGAFSNVNATYGDTAQTITPPTSSTPGTFTYSSSNTAVATISGSTLTFAGAGTSTITANFTPTDTTNYTTNSTSMTVTVSQGTPVLGAFSNVNATYGDTAQTITAPTADTAGSFTYSSSNTAVATVSGSTLTFAGAGTSTITANFTPTDTTNYTTNSTTMTVTVAQATPTLGVFSNVSGNVGDSAATITPPTSSTPGTFTYTSGTPAVASISGDQISFLSVGSSLVTANFTPTDTTNYTTNSTTMTIAVGQATPTLGPFSNVSATFGDSATTITAPTSSTPGTFAYTSSNTAVATVSGSTLTFTGAGTSTITANFTPTDSVNYAAVSTTMTVTIARATPTLGLFSGVSATFGDSPATITPPTSSTPGTFTYSSSNTSVATISGASLTFTGAGTSTITANFTPTDTTNYTTASTTMTVTVGSPPPPTTIPPTPATTTTTTTTIAPAPVAPTTTTTTTTTTTLPSLVPTPGFAEPEVYAPSDDIFGDTEGEQVVLTIDATVGDPAANAPIQIRAVALSPGARVTVTVYSDPQVLLTGTADSNGVYEATTFLPSNLEAGRHTLLAATTGGNGIIEVAGAFIIDEDGIIDRLVQPAVITGFVGPDDDRLSRALDLDRPVWDVAARPLTTAAIAISGIALLGIAGIAGLSGAPSTVRGMGTATSDGGDSGSNSGQRKRNARGKLSGVVTKKLKGIQIESTARGDLSSSWVMPGTAKTDEFSRSAPGILGRYSAAAPRVFVDGAWLRAIFGSFGFLSWGLGLVLGIVAAFVDTNSPLTPIYPLLLAMIVLGILDAAAGAIAWITLLVIALITGNIAGWPDIRTALGLGILLATISLLAHVIRPLRRYCAQNASEAWERFFDYAMMPIFVAFASGSALKALNGLSGLEIVTSSEVSTMRWVVGIAVIARLACEDIASHWYPERMIMVQPAKLVSPGRSVSGVSIVIRSLVFLMIAEPFFGLTATTILAAVLLAIPVVMKLWEDDLPNSAWLNKWLPRGLFRFLCLLILGMYLTAVFIGKNGGDSAIKSSFIWLLLPGVVVGVVELFARFGGEWPNVTVRRSLGAVVWVTAASLVTGYLILFI